MAYENIDITESSFCIGPKAGTFCYVDTSGVNAVMRLHNSSGASVAPHTVDFYPTNIIAVDSDAYPKNIVQAFKYFGPTGQSDVFDNLPFYTLERYTDSGGNSSEFTIRRWLRDSTNNRLVLDTTITKSSSGDYQYDAHAMAIEYVSTEFNGATDSGTGYITVDSVEGISVGSEVMLGPSTDVLPSVNLNAVEFVTVSGIIGNDLYLNTVSGYIPPYYQYQNADPITVNKDYFVFSDKSYANEADKGSIYRFTPAGNYIEHDNQGTYYGTIAADWVEVYNGIAFVHATNIVSVDPTTLSGLGWYKPIKSISLTNISSNDIDILPVYDLEFSSTDIYKLQKAVTKTNDDGDLSTSTWTNYNYVLNTFTQYSSNVGISAAPNGVLSQDDTITVRAVVRNQFGVGLSGKNIQFYDDGDPSAYFTPIDGQATTNISGVAEVLYTSGGYSMAGGVYQGYNGISEIDVRTDGGNVGYGSVYLWDKIFLQTNGSYESYGDSLLEQLPTLSGGTPDISWPIYTEIHTAQVSGIDTYYSLVNKTKFSFPGGDWYFDGFSDRPPVDHTTKVRQTFLPTLQQGAYEEADARVDLFLGQYDAMYQRVNPEDDNDPKNYITQVVSGTNDLQLSQTYVSRHVLTGHTDTTEVDQYIFVQDAIPSFWSYKNTTTTDIWIRLLPFADSLNGSTLIFKIREVSYAGDTGFYDITNDGTITPFDAGGGLLGVEFEWNNPGAFHNNAVVYVYLEIEDNFGNVIVVEYWFQIIPDYKTPYLENLFPAREEPDVPIGTNISFDIIDVGTGVDIDTLVMTVNGRTVTPTTTKITGNKYEVNYIPAKDFIYAEGVEVSVRVDDTSDQSNPLLDSWRFYTEGSTGPWFDFDSFSPIPCSEGVERMNKSVSFNVFDINDTGIDQETVLVSIGGKYRNVTMTPILYRIK